MQYAVQGYPSDRVKGLLEVNENDNKVDLLGLAFDAPKIITAWSMYI